MTKAELQAKALKLPEEERRSLGMLLVDSTLPPLSIEQERLIEERLASYEADPNAWLSQEDFDAELRNRLSRGT